MPLAATFEAIAAQCRGEYRRKVLAAAHYLRQGGSLPEVIGHEPGLFPRDAEVLVRVGSTSGVLPAALREAAGSQAGGRGPWIALSIRAAYLLWVLMVMQAIMAFLFYFVLPKFEAIFADFGIPLPAVTVMTINVAHVITRYLWIILPIVLFQIGLFALVLGMGLGILPWNLPLVGRVFLSHHSALILRCLARVVEGDKPLDRGLAVLAATYPATAIRRRLERVAYEVQQGDDWCEALARNGLVRLSEAMLIDSARRVGNLPWALGVAAENIERRFAYRLQLAAYWLLPLVVVALGAIVFVVAVSYFIPLLLLISRLAA
jgi:protein transport protein HofC